MMTAEEVEKEIKESGPRVRQAYGWSYYYGWCAGLRRMARMKDDK